MTFTVDTRAEHPVAIPARVAPHEAEQQLVFGATGNEQPACLQGQLWCQLGGHLGLVNFCPYRECPISCWVEAYGQSWGTNCIC